MASRKRKVLSVVGGVVILLVPWVTFGFGTPFSLVAGAAILGSCLLGVTSLVSLVSLIVAIAFFRELDGVLLAVILTNWFGGGILAAILTVPVIRALRRDRDTSPRPRPADGLQATVAEQTWTEIANDPHVRRALTRRSRRRYAREILAKDPALATDLGIGRPDLGLGFNDGGLVDVNGVPVEVLAGLPGFDRAMAEKVEAARQRHGPFASGDELVVYADVPNQVVSHLADRLVYRMVTGPPGHVVGGAPEPERRDGP